MKKILIIEDDRAHSMVLEKTMEKEGFKVETAFDGISGLEAIKKSKPDLVILDLLLPKLNGMTVLRETREKLKNKSVKILILTNLIDDLKNIEARDLGVLDYLVKSDYSIKKISERIKEFLKS